MYHPGGRILLRPDAMPIRIGSAAALASNVETLASKVEITEVIDISVTPNFENIEETYKDIDIPDQTQHITEDRYDFEEFTLPEITATNVSPENVDALEEICQSRFSNQFLTNVSYLCSYRISEQLSSYALF